MITKKGWAAFLFAKFILILYTVSAVASTADTTLPDLPTIIRNYSEQEWNLNEPSKGLDTGFADLNAPDPVIRSGGQHLGIIGSPARSTWFQPTNSIFKWCGWTQYEDWMLRSDKTRYYRTNKRLTRADYHMASFREQTIEVFHSQNIIKNWNAGIRFKRMNVKDFLPRSDTYLNRFHFF
ncbi:MAG: putative porin, partial [Flavobacteriales bacterium]